MTEAVEVRASGGGPPADLEDRELRCLNCDYCLFGLTSDVCPECGSLVDWARVREAAGHKGLPLDLRTGWGRITGAFGTWIIVLFRPGVFARDVSERGSAWPAVLFGGACLLIGVLANMLFGIEHTSGFEATAWAIGCWCHIELQSLLFFLLDLRRSRRLRQWSFWRKVSLYTTAFVPLDWLGDAPAVESYWKAKFPWLLDSDTWAGHHWDLPFLARGVAYYWWIVVLSLTLWRRLRRKWRLIIILLLMPLITMASCRLGYYSARALESIGFPI